MPKKIWQLKRDLSRAGYHDVPGRGKGSNSVWVHPLTRMVVTLAGQDGDDALPYQEKLVRRAIANIPPVEGG